MAARRVGPEASGTWPNQGIDELQGASVVLHSDMRLSCSPRHSGLGSRDLGQDVVGAGSPDEALRTGVVMLDIEIDLQFEFRNAGESVASDAAPGDVAEEPLDHDQPWSGALVRAKYMTKRGCRRGQCACAPARGCDGRVVKCHVHDHEANGDID